MLDTVENRGGERLGDVEFFNGAVENFNDALNRLFFRQKTSKTHLRLVPAMNSC